MVNDPAGGVLASGAPEACRTGLDYYRQSSTTSDEPGELPDRAAAGELRCPAGVGWVLANSATGEVIPMRCGRNRCGYCLPRNARRRAAAMAWVGCDRSITITNVATAGDPDPWQTVRRTYNRTREYLTRMAVDPGVWGVFVERGSRTGMVHVHVAQRGAGAIPKKALQEAAHRAGAGWTRIERIRAGAGFSDYVGKGFSSYVGKGFTEQDGANALVLNGGRLGHFSRGFFVSPTGGTLGVREAETLASRARSEEESGTWVLMREVSGAGTPRPA
jgi:hypothetical protein